MCFINVTNVYCLENSNRCQLVNSTETFVHLHKMFMDNIQQIDINQNDLTDKMIDKLLDRSELYEEIEKKETEEAVGIVN